MEENEKSVEQTFLEIHGFEKLENGSYNIFESMFEYIRLETLSDFVKYLESEGHIQLTGTYKP